MLYSLLFLEVSAAHADPHTMESPQDALAALADLQRESDRIAEELRRANEQRDRARDAFLQQHIAAGRPVTVVEDSDRSYYDIGSVVFNLSGLKGGYPSLDVIVQLAADVRASKNFSYQFSYNDQYGWSLKRSLESHQEQYGALLALIENLVESSKTEEQRAKERKERAEREEKERLKREAEEARRAQQEAERRANQIQMETERKIDEERLAAQRAIDEEKREAQRKIDEAKRVMADSKTVRLNPEFPLHQDIRIPDSLEPRWSRGGPVVSTLTVQPYGANEKTVYVRWGFQEGANLEELEQIIAPGFFERINRMIAQRDSGGNAAGRFFINREFMKQIADLYKKLIGVGGHHAEDQHSLSALITAKAALEKYRAGNATVDAGWVNSQTQYHYLDEQVFLSENYNVEVKEDAEGLRFIAQPEQEGQAPYVLYADAIEAMLNKFTDSIKQKLSADKAG